MVFVKKCIKFCLRIFANFLSCFCYKKSVFSCDEARREVTKCSPKPRGIAQAKNKLLAPICDLQIIIPAYNVEKYLHDCMESVLSQKTKYSYKIVLIDDGSTDSTGIIADSYQDDPRVVVIHQANKGFSGARNTGLAQLFGRYIMFLDSDDMLCEGAINALMDAAIFSGADVVEGGMYQFYDSKDIRCGYRHKYNAFFKQTWGQLKGFPCGKVYKTSFWSNVIFPDGYWFEDTMLAFLLFPQIQKSYHISDIVYYYRQNPSSITHTFAGKSKVIDTYWITEQMMQEHCALNLPNDMQYTNQFFHQIILNQARIKDAPHEIQESAFVLTCDLYQKYLKDSPVHFKYKILKSIIIKKRFLVYQKFCKWYFV